MSSHSVASGLNGTLPIATLIFGNSSSDRYDVMITFHSAEVQFCILLLHIL